MTNASSLLQEILAVVDKDLPTHDVLYHHRGQIGDMHFDGVDEGEADKPLKLAAVLVGLVPGVNKELEILLTRRADHLDSHSGQVAFPGGKVEAGDASPLEAALREAHEEIGLHPEFVEVAGFLDTYETGTGFRVLPVVASLRAGFSLTADKNEVADIFRVPARVALDEKNYTAHDVEWEGRQRKYYALQYEGYKIWGATAGMLVNMGRRLKI
ncbi:CoA pyrophosphatase [Alphaproteobacteria bacterium]|nr:CoA pyrophosphatase [Alphaproteobacteria bacterium]